MRRFGKIALGALMLGGAAVAAAAPANAARVAVGIGIGVPAYGYGYGYGYPYYGYGYGPVAYGAVGPRYWWHGRWYARHPYYHRYWRRW